MMADRLHSRIPTMIAAGAAIILVAAMALDTKVVRIGSSNDVQAETFTPATYGKTEFPKVQGAIDKRAVDASTLAAAIAKDQDGAAKQYGVMADAGPEFAVKLMGKLGKPDDSGIYPVAVDGIPDGVHITVQTGPAIIGTDLRDGSGLIDFGQFKNQIEYQNAGSALNNAMKAEILAKVDPENLAGKTVRLVGVFQLTDPAEWQVTPSRMDVQ